MQRSGFGRMSSIRFCEEKVSGDDDDKDNDDEGRGDGDDDDSCHLVSTSHSPLIPPTLFRSQGASSHLRNLQINLHPLESNTDMCTLQRARTAYQSMQRKCVIIKYNLN